MDTGNDNKVTVTNCGRPLKFKTPEELQAKIDDYFKSCYDEVWVEKQITDENGKVVSSEWLPVLDRHGDTVVKQIKPFTITGLALSLNTSRETLLDYEEKDGFSDTVKRAKMIIHNFIEEQCVTRDKPTGAIFNLKNNFGWKDKNETEITGKNGGPIQLEALTAEQRESRIQELMEKRGVALLP